MVNRPLSILECTALGIIFKQGPCNAHTVLRQFANSPTGAYRSGAGSVYPMIKRLVNGGYLQSSGSQLSITECGVQAIRNWIVDSSMESATSNLDPIRSRIYFLRLLNGEEAQSFVDQTIAALEQLLEICRRDLTGYESSGDTMSALAQLGAVRETEARIAWLFEVRLALGER